MAGAATASPTSPRWLFGPAPDLLLGCGLGYVGLFALFVAAGSRVLEATPLWVVPLAILLFSMPHYGATLVRVYEHREDRRAYAIFSVYATLAIAGIFAAGLFQAGVASALLTLYLTWSPWHYTGQNYGLTVMFLRRRGLPASGATKRWLHASFVSSYVLAFCVMHESSLWATLRGLPLGGTEIRFVPLGLPAPDWIVPCAAAAWVFVTGVALAQLVRRAGVREGLPSLALVLTQSLWFAVPALVTHWRVASGAGPLDVNLLGAFLVWIAVGHAVQYLWVTLYYARASSGWSGPLPWLAKTLAAGALVWTLPVLLLAPPALGAPGYHAGLALLVASAVNVHHFVLDGAIWKLRSSRIARVLVQSRRSAEEPPGRGSGWLSATVWTAGGACALVAAGVFVLESVQLPRAVERGDAAAAERVLDRLALVGRDSPEGRAHLAGLLASEGRYREARAQVERSLALQPSAGAHGIAAALYAQRGEVERALESLEQGVALGSRDPAFLTSAASLAARLGRTERARELQEATASLRAAGPGAAPLSPDRPRRY